MNKQQTEVLAKSLEAWEATFQMCGGEGVRTHTKVSDLGDLLGKRRDQLQPYARLMKHLGLYRAESEWGGGSQKVYWTIQVSLEEGRKKITEFIRKGGTINSAEAETSKPRKMNGHAEEVVAIVGEDAPMPMESLRSERKNEPEALLEAARQYANRQTTLDEKMSELEALGLTVNHEAMIKAVSWKSDPFLESVAALLPEFDRRARVNERLVAERESLRAELIELRREVGQLRTSYNSEKEANRRLSERNVLLATAR